MNLKQAIRKYGRRFPVVAEYDDYDKYIYVNEDDEDLQKWRVSMPEPPDWKEIEGFGEKPKNQVFDREVIPPRLTLLIQNTEKRCHKNRLKKDTEFEVQRKIYNTLWNTIETQGREYKDEISWIRNNWYYMLNGKWYFIKGKPTYINGWNWFYLNFWPLEGSGLPDYRARDRRWFHAQLYAYTTTETIDYKVIIKELEDGTIEKHNQVQLLDDGTPKMIDIGTRTLFGTNNLKGRRIGATSASQEIMYCLAFFTVDANIGIQANSDQVASDIFHEKLLYAYNKLPFFFVPESPNFYNKSGLYFAGAHGKGGLNSKITPATTSKKEFFDQRRLDGIHTDEVSKTLNEDINERHGVVKRCCSAGDLIKGLMIYTSTTENMENSAGKAFEKLSMESMFDQRLSNGQTISGLINVYFPMYEAYEGFIDKYGDPIIESPTNDQIPYMCRIQKNDDGEIMGAKEYLEKTEKDLADKGDLEAYSQFQRQHPKTFKECFSMSSRGNKFNTKILIERINYLKFSRETKVRTGDFVWTGERFNSPVEFVDKDNGNFRVSMQLPKDRASKTSFDDGVKIPMFDEGLVISADPYRFSETDGARESKGSIVAFRSYDYRIDDGKEKRDWDSYNFVCSYNNREEDINAYCDAVLRCAIYYNALVFPENNLPFIQEYFINNGYKGYLLFDVNSELGTVKKNAGWSSAGPSIKGNLFTGVDTWINFHAHKCHHIDILEDFLTIQGFDDMRNKDIFVAAAGCILAANNKYTEIIKKFSNTSFSGIDVTSWWK